MAALDEPRTAHLPLAPPTRFLQAHEAVGERVALASYPRSGNSLLRKLVEQATGVITGADTLPERTLSQALQRCGARGEGGDFQARGFTCTDRELWKLNPFRNDVIGFQWAPCRRI